MPNKTLDVVKILGKHVFGHNVLPTAYVRFSIDHVLMAKEFCIILGLKMPGLECFGYFCMQKYRHRSS